MVSVCPSAARMRTLVPFIVMTPTCFGTLGKVEHDVVARIGADAVVARIEEVQAGDGQPAVVAP